MTTPHPACPIDIIRRCQEALFATLPPDSKVSNEDAISALLSILDSPEARLVIKAHEHAQAVRDFQRRFAEQLVELYRVEAVKQAAQDPEATIAHLRHEVERRRKHEGHLIQARDELILKLSAAEKQLAAVRAALA